MTTPIDELARIDPWQWLHDNEFSWDDVNAVAAILDAGGFDITRRSTPVPASNDEDQPCVGCGQPTRSRTDDGTPRHIDCPASNVSEGLRDAATRLVNLSDDLARWDEAHGYMVNSERDALAGEVADAWSDVRAALAHAAPEGLDVERLARAWLNAMSPEHNAGCLDQGAFDCPVGAEVEEFVTKVAAEYAVLSQPDATEEGNR